MKPYHEMLAYEYHRHFLGEVSSRYKIEFKTAWFLHRRKETDKLHLAHLEEACRSGIRISDKVLDSLYPPYRTHILRFYPDLHASYTLPEVRELEKGKSDWYRVDQDELRALYEANTLAYMQIYDYEAKGFRGFRIGLGTGEYKFELIGAWTGNKEVAK